MRSSEDGIQVSYESRKGKRALLPGVYVREWMGWGAKLISNRSELASQQKPSFNGICATGVGTDTCLG